jgi:hypothetical protein
MGPTGKNNSSTERFRSDILIAEKDKRACLDEKQIDMANPIV